MVVDNYGTALQKAIHYQEQGADEVVFMDVTPFNERRRNLPRFLRDASERLKIPFVIGGGVHTIQNVEEMLKAGAKRIYVNSAAVKNPELISKISLKYGAESLLVAIDTKKSFEKWKVYLNGGKSRTEIDLLNWVKMSEVRGAGELLISVITKGQQEHEAAFELLSEITSSTHLPILASIGISSVEDFGKLFSIPGIDGIVTGYFLKKDAASIQEIKSQLEGIS